MIFRPLVALLVSGIWVGSASAATVELARRADGTSLVGVKVEGDIVPGDALKLLGIYEYYGFGAASTVYLMSKGGDVEEAMTMGRLIHTLRLETAVPDRIQLPTPMSLASPTSNDDVICASACFLIFAGGIDRHGDFLVLHRPYFSRQGTTKLSDLDQEAAQKQLMASVRDYLQAMEIDPFYIDKMMSTNSQDGYVVTAADLAEHDLEKMPPSIEEIVLTKCDAPPWHDLSQLSTGSNATPAGRQLRDQTFQKIKAAWDCKEKPAPSR